MTPQRIQLRRTKGWRKPEGAVMVARPSRWGNPFTIQAAVDAGFLAPDDAPENGRALVTAVFRSWLTLGPDSGWWYDAGKNLHAEMRAHLHELRGRDLACWCPLDQPCHADVLLGLANR